MHGRAFSIVVHSTGLYAGGLEVMGNRPLKLMIFIDIRGAKDVLNMSFSSSATILSSSAAILSSMQTIEWWNDKYRNSGN